MGYDHLPKTLNDIGKKLWKRIYTAEREPSLVEAYCVAYQTMVQAQQTIAKEGFQNKNSCIILRSSMSAMNQLSVKLGLEKRQDNTTDTLMEGLIDAN